MPRAPRPQVAGGIYHVTARGVRKSAVFRDTVDRLAFLALVAGTAERKGWKCLSYCLLTTHYHLLVQTPLPNISPGMCELNGKHARRYNERHCLDGHVFERRFAAKLVETEDHLFESIRYIDLNPVRAGVCASPADWPWSSYRAMVGLERPRSFLSLDLRRRFGGAADGIRSYERFVLDALRAE